MFHGNAVPLLTLLLSLALFGLGGCASTDQQITPGVDAGSAPSSSAGGELIDERPSGSTSAQSSLGIIPNGRQLHFLRAGSLDRFKPVMSTGEDPFITRQCRLITAAEGAVALSCSGSGSDTAHPFCIGSGCQRDAADSELLYSGRYLPASAAVSGQFAYTFRAPYPGIQVVTAQEQPCQRLTSSPALDRCLLERPIDAGDHLLIERGAELIQLSLDAPLAPGQTALARLFPDQFSYRSPEPGFHSADNGSTAQLEQRLDALLSRAVILVADDQQPLFRFDKPEGVEITPASIVKIATSLVALERLGGDYRFETDFSLDGNRNLFIQGRGDPYLVSEEWTEIATTLRAKGLTEVSTLCVDDSLITPLQIPGLSGSSNPYDAINGALIANFNTINVRIAGDGSISSAEPQTPLTEIAVAQAVRLKPGRQRINLGTDYPLTWRYAGELFAELLRQQGISVGGVRRDCISDGEVVIRYRHRNSRSLEEVVKGLMKYSNNFIANQLLLGLALNELQPPVTYRDGLAIVQRYLEQEIGTDRSEIYLVEGSGISRENRLSAEGMIKLLRAFLPYRYLMESSPDRTVFYKSGTLRGVYNYAGYLERDNGSTLFFVLKTAGSKNRRDEALDALKKSRF